MAVKKRKRSYLYLVILLIALGIFLISIRQKSNPAAWKKVIRRSRHSDLEKYLIAQSKLESANYTSRLFREVNNTFGMNCVRKRQTNQTGCTAAEFDGGMSKGIYHTVTDSFIDMLIWLDYTNFPESVSSAQDYVNELGKRKFFGTSKANYLKALNSYL